MVRIQRLDHENQKFPIVLMFLFVVTSLGTISFIFLGNRPVVIPESNSIPRFHNGAIGSEDLPTDDISPLQSMVSKNVILTDVVYIIPGGGSGNGIEYPEWSRQRVVAAHKHSIEQENKQPIFLALSAGSLNSPNSLQTDSRIVFECQFMIAHLLELGASKDSVFGDFMSWDTVSNGLVARQFLEGLLAVRSHKENRKNLRSSNYLQVNVFISDFHAERVKAAFNWILGLEPSLFNGGITLVIHSVSTEDIVWSNKEEFEERVKHEENGVLMMQQNCLAVTTIAELYAFLLLGPHKGFHNYLHDSYSRSQGAGW
jgi:hypothetical protein